jgi:exo-1,4-beta-D-glucosaminidase
VASSNFYWLSTKPDVSNWQAGNGRYTPLSSYADLTGLETLPKVALKLSSHSESKGGDEVEHVTVENPSNQLAFFVHLRVLAGGKEVAPVIWEDNYVTLMPGEKRDISATVHRKDLRGAKATVGYE